MFLHQLLRSVAKVSGHLVKLSYIFHQLRATTTNLALSQISPPPLALPTQVGQRWQRGMGWRHTKTVEISSVLPTYVCQLLYVSVLKPSHPQEWSISNFPCSLSRNITPHSMKNLAFHSFLRLKMNYTTNQYYLATSLIHFLFKMLRELRSERVKGVALVGFLSDYELYKGAMRRTASALLPLQSLAGDLFPFEGNTKRASFFSEANPSHRPLDSEYETKRRSFFGELFRGRDLESYTLIPGPDCSDDGLSVDRKCCLDQAPNEQYPSPWVKRADASLYVGASGHSAKKMKMKQRPTIPSPYKQSAVVVNNHKCVTLLVELREKCHSVLFPGNQTVSPTDKEGTTQMLSSSRQESLEEDIHTSSSTISSGVVTDCPILDTSVRRSYRSHTTSSTDSGASMEEGKETTSFLKFDALDPQAEWNLSMNRPKPVTSIQVRPPSWGVECQELKLAIEPELGSCAGMEPKHMDEKPRSLREWFTYPTFYKVSRSSNHPTQSVHNKAASYQKPRDTPYAASKPLFGGRQPTAVVRC